MITRPAVIIGLGGTGQWILTYLKKDLLELNNGVLPSNIRLLAFDTVSEAEAKKQVVGGAFSGAQATYEKAAKRIGSVELDPDVELLHIGGDCYTLGKEMLQGKHPHLNWFDVDYWMNKAGLGRDNWILDRGAGRFRQFGLLAVYKDLMGGPVRSQILKKLPTAIDEVLASTEGDASFEIIVVGSVAGGTGSAMIVPFGALARQMCGDKPVRTRAIVVLPSAFSPGRTNDDLELRSGAALRELARAMMPPEGYVASTTFIPGDSNYGNVPYSRPFDGIYFIDGIKDGKPVNNDPKYGVFPAVSSWVRQILDKQSGQWFTNYVATNRAGTQSTDIKRLAEGVFGVFGVHSFFVPERSLRWTYRYKLGDRVLRELTVPKAEGPGGGLVPNYTPRGMPPAPKYALDLLRTTAVHGEEQQPVSTLINLIANITDAGGAADLGLVQATAQAGWYSKRKSEREERSWMAPLFALPASGQFGQLNQDIEQENRHDFTTMFKPSMSFKPPKDPRNRKADFSKQIPSYVAERLGGQGADGADDYGSLGVIAIRCADAHEGIFRKALRLHLLTLLADNKGKDRLGYTIAVLYALQTHLENFLNFMEKVRLQRAALTTRGELEGAINTARGKWTTALAESPTLMERLQKLPSKKALLAEKSLLTAHRQSIYYVQEEALHIQVRSVASSMLAYTTGALRELERWAKTLLEGDRALDINGLLPEMEKDVGRVTTLIREDERSEEVERLVQVAARESDIDDADVDWALNGVQWSAEDEDGVPRFTLAFHPQGVEGGTLQVPRAGMSVADRRKIEQENRGILGQVMEQRFGQVEELQNVLDWCRDHPDFGDAKQLAVELDEATKPLTDLGTTGQPAMEAFSISVNHEVDPTGYAQRLEDAARVKVAGGTKPDNNRPVEVIGAEDPYRLTAVRTQLGLMLEDFVAWDTSQEAYEKQVQRVEELSDAGIKDLTRSLQSQYTQREEKEAIELEVKWRSGGFAHRVLNPRVVSLVGKRRLLQTALQCWALGWVNYVADEQFPDRYHWQLDVPDWDYEFWLTPNREKDAQGVIEALEAFVLIGRNNARGRERTKLDEVSLNETLLKQRKSPEEGSKPSTMREKVDTALGKGGLIDQWLDLAGRYIDPNQDKERFRNPAYHDLADYAKRYFKAAEW